MFEAVYPETDPITDTQYTLMNLDPCSLYFVLVIAENGVSSQAGGEDQRSVGQFLLTTEGSRFEKRLKERERERERERGINHLRYGRACSEMSTEHFVFFFCTVFLGREGWRPKNVLAT